MALSQLQCLDDNHVNWRTNESKPEFFYSEDQRLALEAYITKGRDAFDSYVKERELRPFLSEPELEHLRRIIEDYKPGSEHQKADGTTDGEDYAVSLQYWPDRSDISIPNFDLGWPDCNSYRGVTRVHVYTHPPSDGHTHIKEVVRKAIAQAQKMIAVVMDVFTDVDIFKDLIEVGFKKKVAIYIIIDHTAVQNFLHMCERAKMHRGHLNNLRVRCIGGADFYTRSAQRVFGSLSSRFMFVDGDRAVSGSYSFTWTASRLDRNVITVLTGQAVETFDNQFRELYLNSHGVNLSKVPMVDPPEPEPTIVTVPPPVSAAVARKLINPKYALVNVDASSKTSSDKASAKNSSSHHPMAPVPKPNREVTEKPKLHPGLEGLLKADLIPYLPTWPEPDPSSDVIGFIKYQRHKETSTCAFNAFANVRNITSDPLQKPFHRPPEDPLPEKAIFHLKKTKEVKKDAVDLNVQSSIQPSKDDQPNTQPVVNLQPETNFNSNHQDVPVHSSNSPNTQTQHNDPKPNPPPQEQQPNPKPMNSSCENQQALQQPVPKPRTLQLVVKKAEGTKDAKITLVKREENQMINPTVTHTDTRDNDADSMDVTCAHSLKDKDEASTTSDEYFECADSDTASPTDLLPNGRMTGSGRVDRSPDSLNVMARLSQSMLDLRSDNDNKSTLEKNLLNTQNTEKQRSPARDIYGRAKVVNTKPGAFHKPPNTSGDVIGGHRYWQGKMYDPNLPSSGLQQQNLNRTGRSPQRHNPAYGIQGLQSAVLQRKSHSPQRQVETRTPLGISFSKLASFKHLRGKVSVNPAGFPLGDQLSRGRNDI